MLIISNNARKYMKLPKGAIVRINTAWYETANELFKEIKALAILGYKIYLDIPSGRKKPPLPKLDFEDVEFLLTMFKNIKYLALSNVEDWEALNIFHKILCSKGRADIEIVPKIETKTGIKALKQIKSHCPFIHSIMLDKEDLYTDCGTNREYLRYVAKARDICYTSDIKLLELQGVVFG